MYSTRMDKVVSAADANRRLSDLLRTVKEGRIAMITSHGNPVARIIPVVHDLRVVDGARFALLARLQTEQAVKVVRWRRDELYDEVT